MKKLAFAVAELVLIAFGSAVFVHDVLRTSFHTASSVGNEAGIGAFMVISGLLLKGWKKDFFSNRDKLGLETGEYKEKEASPSKVLVAGMAVLFAFTFWGFSNAQIKRTKVAINSVESDVDYLESEVSNHESEIEELESNAGHLEDDVEGIRSDLDNGVYDNESY